MKSDKVKRGRGCALNEQGPAFLLRASLSKAQHGWLTSQGLPMAALVRMLIDDAMAAKADTGDNK
jgi:hypothetical protein